MAEDMRGMEPDFENQVDSEETSEIGGEGDESLPTDDGSGELTDEDGGDSRGGSNSEGMSR